jgi:hypothetical protein
MSHCCGAPVYVVKKEMWCTRCNKQCRIDTENRDYVVKIRDNGEMLIHFSCEKGPHAVTTLQTYIDARRCKACEKFLK